MVTHVSFPGETYQVYKVHHDPELPQADLYFVTGVTIPNGGEWYFDSTLEPALDGLEKLLEKLPSE